MMLKKILFQKIPYLNLLIRLSKKYETNVWLVGGYLRDLFLFGPEFFEKKNDGIDFDFCVQKDVYSFVCEFSLQTNSKLIVLDESQASYRVVIKKRLTYTYDFTKMRAQDFKNDLLLRDFTINTLAVNLIEKDFKLIDYFDAKVDLKLKKIRMINQEVFKLDPLRILRGFSFMANYNFSITEDTKLAMKKYRNLLRKVSAERISEELFKILASLNSYKTFKLMSDLEIIDSIIPQIKTMRKVSQGKYHHLDVWDHSLETLKEFEVLYRKKFSKEVDILNYLNEEISPFKKRIYVVKLACLLHDIGKPKAKKRKNKKTIFYGHERIGRDLVSKISDKLRFSFKIKDMLSKLVFWHLRPGYLADQNKPTQRAVYRFFRDTQTEGVAVMLLSLADWRATRGPLTDSKKRAKHQRIIFKLIKEYFEESKKKPLKKIVDGYDIMKKFSLPPSPLIGKILNKIKEEQALGKVKTKLQAYRVAKEVIKKEGL